MAPHNKSKVTREKAAKYVKRNRSTDETLAVQDSLNGTPAAEITPPEPPKKKGRGAGKIKAVSDNIDNRPELITATITRLALGLMPAPLRSFHGFDKKSKLNLEREFLERYRYAKDEDPDRCREVLEAIAGKRYCTELSTARKNRITKYKWNLAAWKADVPHWCTTPEHWRGLCDIFFTEDWQMVSKQNQINRKNDGNPVSHYAGSASAHQHFWMLTNLNNGNEPTMEDLYIHMHCARENGVSPVVAQIKASENSSIAINENSDGNGGVNPTADKTSEQVHEYDINSLQFTSTRKEEVYRKVKEMRADHANSGLDDSTLFLTALGGPSHGRVLGFGSLLQQKVKTAATRERSSHIASSITGLTNIGEQENFSRAEVLAIVQEREGRITGELTEMKREQAQNQLMFSQLFKMVGHQLPPSEVSLSKFGVMLGF
ncbi:uncharacterized protein LOC144563938 [Carex rostrata]